MSSAPLPQHGGHPHAHTIGASGLAALLAADRVVSHFGHLAQLPLPLKSGEVHACHTDTASHLDSIWLQFAKKAAEHNHELNAQRYREHLQLEGGSRQVVRDYSAPLSLVQTSGKPKSPTASTTTSAAAAASTSSAANSSGLTASTTSTLGSSSASSSSSSLAMGKAQGPAGASDGAPKRRGRGKERQWSLIRYYDNDSEAKGFVAAERTWVMQKKTQVQEGTKVYYECSKYRSARCPAAVSLLYHANSDKVSVFRASGDHNHAPVEKGVRSKNAPQERCQSVHNEQHNSENALPVLNPHHSAPEDYRPESAPTLLRPVATYPKQANEPIHPLKRFKMQHASGQFDYLTKYPIQEHPEAQMSPNAYHAFKAVPRSDYTELSETQISESSMHIKEEPGLVSPSIESSSSYDSGSSDLSRGGAPRCFIPDCPTNRLPRTESSSSSKAPTLANLLGHTPVSPPLKYPELMGFPDDVLLRMVWSMNVNLSNPDGTLKLATSSDFLCEAHFTTERFDSKGNLRKDAVPTLFGDQARIKEVCSLPEHPEQMDCKVTTSKEVKTVKKKSLRARVRSATLARRLRLAQLNIERMRIRKRSYQSKINLLKRLVQENGEKSSKRTS
ncbi:uncharacterized protein LOC114828448 [Galendromus occidentalis]|uniref:Uncharacterized protein LOC114828448 n=1 Tax=Galendromus occidentalis TaxID=34638 RepID=A0AAJ7WIM3_9ACAR|nr:uncharacterized protein LOC114828448 [Galendromus occidentalis]